MRGYDRQVRVLLTSEPGLEDVVVGEVEELYGGRASVEAVIGPYDRGGQVRVEVDRLDRLFRLGTVHHLVELRCECRAETMDEVRVALTEAPFDELTGAVSFRVSSTCRETEIDRIDLQRAAGAVLVERYGTRVDLEGFEVNVRVDLYGGHLVAGLQHTRDSLGNRVRRGGRYAVR